MECRGFCRRLRLHVADVPLWRLYNSTARFCGLPKTMACLLALDTLDTLDYEIKTIAFAASISERVVRRTIKEAMSRIGARGRGDCVRILQESDPVLRRERQFR